MNQEEKELTNIDSVNLKTNNNNTTLEDNIINIEIPEDALKNIETVIEPVVVSEEKIENTIAEPIKEEIVEEKSSAMIEKKKDDDTVSNSKGALPVFIIFGLFIVFLIAFPYISNYLDEKEQAKKDEEFEQYKDTLNPKPSSTPTTDTTSTFDELYNSCGTKEIFTNITINYTLIENQCFKIKLNNTKSFIKYVPAINESENWSIYLGEKEIFTLSKTSTNTISSINIINNSVELKEVDALGNVINTHTFDGDGNKVNNQ